MPLQQQLYQLYLLDRQVRGLQSRLDQAIKLLSVQQTRLDRLNQQRSELDGQHKHAQAKAALKESESQGVVDRVTKLREQMNAARNNKEYQAFLLEVNTLKNDQGKLEEEALEHLDKVDQLTADRDALLKRLEDQEKLVVGAAKDVDVSRQEIGQRLDELTAQRDQAAEQTPAEARSVFEKVAHEFDGETMAPVVEQSRRHKEYTCGGCFMTIPIERVSSLMGRCDEIVVCSSCGRILYMEQELKESLTG